MIAEPYINLSTGEIQWHECIEPMIGNGLREPTPAPYSFSKDGKCIPYADFEREKLRELGSRSGITRGTAGYCLSKKCDRLFDTAYMSKDMGYSTEQYEQDSESNRLLKRAEFLKDICEKEGVQFLPTVEESEQMKTCCIEGCENEGANGRGNHCWKHYHRIRTHGDPHTTGHNWKIESLKDHDGIKKIIEEKVVVDANTGCWEWSGTRSKQGYGKQTIKREKQQTFVAHRLSAMVYLGFDIDSEELVCHKCDNPPCCNPDHLFIGDWKANADDMVQKGRAVDVSDRKRAYDGTFLSKE